MKQTGLKQGKENLSSLALTAFLAMLALAACTPDAASDLTGTTWETADRICSWTFPAIPREHDALLMCTRGKHLDGGGPYFITGSDITVRIQQWGDITLHRTSATTFIDPSTGQTYERVPT